MNLTAVAGVVGYRTKWTANDSLLTSYDVNLSAYWPLGEATGATRYDLVGNYAALDRSSYDSTVEQAAGKFGNCAYVPLTKSYTGLDCLQTTVDLSAIIASKNWTISVWFKLPSLSLPRRPFFCNAYGPGSTGNGVLVGLINSGSYARTRVEFYNAGTMVGYTGTTNISYNAWHHAFVRCASTTMNYYVDNVLHSSYSGTINIGNGYDAHIGNVDEMGEGWEYQGFLDELAIWNTALPNSYAGTLYNSGNGAFRRN